jgi:hypothetical protein
MATRYEQIIANVQSMVNQNAPTRDIDGYLAIEGLSPKQFRSLVEGPTIGGQTKEFFKGLIPGAVGLGEAATAGAAALLPEEMEKGVRGYVGKKAEGVRKAFAPEVGYEETVPRKLGEAVGSTLPFFALGPLGAAGVATGVGVGVAAGAGEARQRAEEAGVTGSDRAMATALGIGPGLLDMVAPELKVAKGIIGRALVKGGVEGATEAAQQVSQNLIAKGIYKPDQPILAGAGEEGAYGAGAGALSSFLLDAALGRRVRTAPTTTPPTITPAGTTDLQQVETNPDTIPREVAKGVMFTPSTGLYTTVDGTPIDIGREMPQATPETGALEMVGKGAPNIDVNQGTLPGIPLELDQVAASEQVAEEVQPERDLPTVLTPEVLINTGLSPKSGFFKRLVNKDLMELPDLDAVQQVIEEVNKNTRLAPETKDALNTIATQAFGNYAQQGEMFGPKGGVLEPVKLPKPEKTTVAGRKIASIMEGKDLSDPAQLEQVRSEVTDYANKPARTEASIAELTKFLDSLPSSTPEATDVTRSIEPNAGAVEQGAAVVGERQEATPTGTEETVGGRLDVAPAPTEQINVGEGAEPTTLTEEPNAPITDSALTGTVLPTDMGKAAPTVQTAPTEKVQAPVDLTPAEGRVDLRTATDRLMFEGNLKRAEATKLARDLADSYDEVGIQDIDDVVQSVKGGKPLYRDNGKGKKGILASRVQKVADTVESRWKNAPPIKVIQRADELPDRLYQQMISDKVKPPGAFDPNTGIVYLISDHIIDERDAALTLSHEVLGHYGIRGVLGNTYTKVMDDIYNGNITVRKQALKKMAEGLDKHTAVEEVLAEMAESGVYNNAIQRIFNAIRQAIRKLGYNFKEVTDTEIRALLANANRFVFSGAQARTDVAAPAFANKPLWRDTTDAFDRWFGNSVVRNANGTPKVMYHGTAQDIHSFKPKQAGAIFVTDDPNFAESFADASEEYMYSRLEEFLPPKKVAEIIKEAKRIAKREGTSVADELRTLALNEMPSRANIIPVYISAQKPFDFSNPEHIAAIEETFRKATNGSLPKEGIRNGLWSIIENKDVQDAIKAAGFDGFYVMEGGRKNLAVYDPGQIKSVFNGGNYDRNDNRILYRTRKEELTPEGQKAAALNERMKGISNPREDGAEAIGKGLAGIKNILNPNEGPGLVTRFRRAVVDSDATANEKIQADFNNALINAMGDVRADLLVDQAQDATGLAESYMELGNIEINKYGLAQTSEKKGAATMKGVFDKLHAFGDKLGSLPLAVQVAHNALIANRANEINAHNAGVQKEIDAALAKKNTKAATALEKKRITIRASAEEIAVGLEAMKTYPEIKAILKEFTDYKNGLVDFLQQTGRINAETAKNWKENAGYVPWTRIEEEVNTFDDAPTMYKTGLINLSQLPKLDREGSSKEIANVFDNMIGLTNWAIKTGLKTRAASALATQLPDAKEIKTDDELKRELKNNKNRVVFAYKDGERTAYLLGSPLDMSAFSNNVEVLGPIVGSFKYMGDLLRGAITHMPAFALSQLVQDGTYRGMLLSGVNNPFSIPPKVFKNFGKALRGELTELQALGITGVYDGMPDQVSRRARERYGIAERSKIKKAWDRLEQFSTAADLAVRAAIYEQTIAETKSDAMPEGDQRLALYRAKEYINFKRAGANPTVRTMRHMIPFMNAYIQGMDVLTRTMQGKGVSLAEKRQAQMLFFGTGLKLAALNMLYTLLVGDDDDYKGLEEYERDKNYIIPGTGLKVPVAPELGFMFKVIPERVILYVASQGTERPQDASDFFRGFRDAFVNAYSTPNAMPQAVKPALEVMVNYSFFTGNPIVGQAMKNVDPSLQFTSGTSEIAKLFGMVGISPMKVDHIIRGYTGMVGAIALDVTDAVADPNRASKPINKIPQISTFMYDPSGRGYKSEFYRFRESVDKVVDTVNLFKREGRVQELHDYLDEDKLKLYAMRGVTSKVEQQLSVLRKYRNIISADPELSGSEKQEKIKEIQAQEKELLLAYNIPRIREISGI